MTQFYYQAVETTVLTGIYLQRGATSSAHGQLMHLGLPAAGVKAGLTLVNISKVLSFGKGIFKSD